MRERPVRAAGDADRRRRDRRLRAKARLKGFQVVELTAEALGDEASLAVHLEELATYLPASGSDEPSDPVRTTRERRGVV